MFFFLVVVVVGCWLLLLVVVVGVIQKDSQGRRGVDRQSLTGFEAKRFSRTFKICPVANSGVNRFARVALPSATAARRSDRLICSVCGLFFLTMEFGTDGRRQ
jgi:hypothetical protein